VSSLHSSGFWHEPSSVTKNLTRSRTPPPSTIGAHTLRPNGRTPANCPCFPTTKAGGSRTPTPNRTPQNPRPKDFSSALPSERPLARLTVSATTSASISGTTTVGLYHQPYQQRYRRPCQWHYRWRCHWRRRCHWCCRRRCRWCCRWRRDCGCRGEACACGLSLGRVFGCGLRLRGRATFVPKT
jgi:hypothetical protein